MIRASLRCKRISPKESSSNPIGSIIHEMDASRNNNDDNDNNKKKNNNKEREIETAEWMNLEKNSDGSIPRLPSS